MRRLDLLRLSLVLAVNVCLAEEVPENIASGAKYTLRPTPNYGYCTDPGDPTQLTDGAYAKGYFWMQKETVGWSGGGNKFLTIDLGQVLPIAGVSFNTAAGVADVRWPKKILVFVSDDGQAWHAVGDLIDLVDPTTLPKYGTYAVRKLTTNELTTRGRYVQLAVEPDGYYCFVDEIEVYRGPQDFLTLKLPGEPVSDIVLHMKRMVFNLLIKDQVRRDLQAAREDIAVASLTDNQQKTLSEKANQLARRIKDMPPISPEGFRAVLPMNDLERDVFAFQAEVWRAQGKPALRLWQAHRWDYLAPSDEPPANEAAPAVEVRMMNGEVRADALNFANAAEKALTLRLRIEGLPGGVAPRYVTVREALHVGTRRFVSVAAALPEARREGNDYLINVPSGMTIQAWFEFKPTDLKPRKHEGFITVTGGVGDPIRVPLRLTISRLRFPADTTLLLGGWDYTDGKGGRGVTPDNRDALVKYLKEHRVNMPWASEAAMPEGRFDGQGNLVEKPDTARFDEWVRKWSGARRYMVFLAKEDAFAGAKMGTKEFTIRVGNWARFWAQHMRDLGLKASQLGFLVYDEPNEAKGYAINEQWAKAIQAAEPELVMFIDPQPPDPEGCLAMMEQMDVLCPHRPQWLQCDWFESLFKGQQAKGRDLWFYSAHNPARSFDPFSYYLMQEWHCFAAGGKGSCFWSFGDNGGVSVWNEYEAEGAGPFCPMYLHETSVTTAKWFEAIREGAQDYEYLVMLRDRIAKLEMAGQAGGEIAKAKELLREGPKRVMAQEKLLNYTWDQPKDRSIADRVRYEVLDVLEKQ